jgi:hypothetical protein
VIERAVVVVELLPKPELMLKSRAVEEEVVVHG